MSSNLAIDAIVDVATNNFEQPRGWFMMHKAMILQMTGISTPVGYLRALEERAKELLLSVRLEILERTGDDRIVIGWGQPRNPVDWVWPIPMTDKQRETLLESIPTSIARLQVSDCIKDLDER